MNVVLWLVQIALAALAFAGGAYKVLMFAELAKLPATSALPRAAWTALGVFEMLCALPLVIPAFVRRKPVVTVIAASALALESLALAAVYARYSLQMAATNPLVWVVAMAMMAVFIAFGRSFDIRR